MFAYFAEGGAVRIFIFWTIVIDTIGKLRNGSVASVATKKDLDQSVSTITPVRYLPVFSIYHRWTL